MSTRVRGSGSAGGAGVESVIRSFGGHLVLPMSARPAQLAGNAAGIQKQVPFTPDDERTIVAFLVAVNPDGKHRNGQQLWKVLEANARDKWPGGPRHSAVSWRNYYIKNADRFDTWVARIVQEEKPSSDASDEGGGTRLKRRKLLHRPHRPVAGTSRSRAPDHGVDDDTNLFSTAHPSLGISAHPHSNVVQDTAVPSAHDEADTPATNLYPRLPAPLSALGLTGVLTTDQKLSSDSDPEPTLPPKPPRTSSGMYCAIQFLTTGIPRVRFRHRPFRTHRVRLRTRRSASADMQFFRRYNRRWIPTRCPRRRCRSRCFIVQTRMLLAQTPMVQLLKQAETTTRCLTHTVKQTQ
ncbi:hypothetical protein BKA62DRAFT_23479 [Auriculariales sp. MPI-PUGE-AT-0066]|nr:hypothetical protein BKA62DRAFT_23479 [Auriculariales sp. MPI-PUGE-AT-0066]